MCLSWACFPRLCDTHGQIVLCSRIWPASRCIYSFVFVPRTDRWSSDSNMGTQVVTAYINSSLETFSDSTLPWWWKYSNNFCSHNPRYCNVSSKLERVLAPVTPKLTVMNNNNEFRWQTVPTSFFLYFQMFLLILLQLRIDFWSSLHTPSIRLFLHFYFCNCQFFCTFQKVVCTTGVSVPFYLYQINSFYLYQFNSFYLYQFNSLN